MLRRYGFLHLPFHGLTGCSTQRFADRLSHATCGEFATRSDKANFRVRSAFTPLIKYPASCGSMAVDAEGSCRRKFIRSRPARFFGTIGFCGLDWVVNRFDRKPT